MAHVLDDRLHHQRQVGVPQQPNHRGQVRTAHVPSSDRIRLRPTQYEEGGGGGQERKMVKTEQEQDRPTTLSRHNVHTAEQSHKAVGGRDQKQRKHRNMQHTAVGDANALKSLKVFHYPRPPAKPRLQVRFMCPKQTSRKPPLHGPHGTHQHLQ